MSHAISDQPSSTSPQKSTATVPDTDAADPPTIINGEDKNPKGCKVRNDGFLYLSCGMFSACFQFIGDSTVACCDAWANCLIDSCEVQQSNLNRTSANAIESALNHNNTSTDHWLRGTLEGHMFGSTANEFTTYQYNVCSGYYDGGHCDTGGYAGFYHSGGGGYDIGGGDFGGGDFGGGDMGGDCGGGGGACGGD